MDSKKPMWMMRKGRKQQPTEEEKPDETGLTQLYQGLLDLKERRKALQDILTEDEKDMEMLERDIVNLSCELGKVTEQLAKKYNTKTEFDKALEEAENVYSKLKAEAIAAALEDQNQEDEGHEDSIPSEQSSG